MDPWPAINFILQTLASSALAIIAFVGIKSTAVGERFLNHHLERKIADLKHVHEEKIEALRADLAHLQDRGRRANELEFDAASKIWHAFVDAYNKTLQAIADFLTFPDLDKLPSEDLAAFLESTELSPQQRAQVSGATDKIKMYTNIMRLRRINIAGAAIYDGRLLLRTNGIFISSETSKRFAEGFEARSKAQIEQQINFQHRDAAGFDDAILLTGVGGEQLLTNLESLVRSTLRRE
jgi:hypothetical protein